MRQETYQNKITQAHLQRKAIVYLRQSSERQVQKNKESQRLQYALVDRAKELGFTEVVVISVDLGSSASIGSKRREGFLSCWTEKAHSSKNSSILKDSAINSISCPSTTTVISGASIVIYT